MFKRMKAYYFPIISILSILLGGIVGIFAGAHSEVLKPFGDIFINLIFTIVAPLVFFSIASSTARIGASGRFWKLFSAMLATFIFTGCIAALVMLTVVSMFPPAHAVYLTLPAASNIAAINIPEQIVSIFTVNDFIKLFSHENMLALIIFSVLVGFATARLGEQAKPFAVFLESGSQVFMKMINLIMVYAPIGFFAYFAVLVGQLGPKILENYLHLAIIYYLTATLYFIFAFTFYAYLAGKWKSVTTFWRHILMPMLTSVATCSSAASIPANLQAAKAMGIAPEIYDTVIPFGAIIHKDGSVLGAVVKIAFLFGLLHLTFSGFNVLFLALLISLLVGTVMGAIPSGGMLGEILILTLYHFPPQTLLFIAAISIIIDPFATLLNVTGDCVCSMLVERMVGRQIVSATNPSMLVQANA